MPETGAMHLGQFVMLDGLPAVVVGLESGAGLGAPEDHAALWFGTPQVKRESEGGPGNPVPEVWTVPIEYLSPCAPPEVKH